MAERSEKEEIVQLVGFGVGQKLYGADIFSVREIIRDPMIETISDGPEFIGGVVRLRGETVPIVDLGYRLGKTQATDTDNRQWVLIAKSSGVFVGYVVDSVSRIMKISADSILPAPELILVGLRSQYIRGVCNTERGLLIVLDLDRLLVADEIDALRKLNVI